MDFGKIITELKSVKRSVTKARGLRERHIESITHTRRLHCNQSAACLLTMSIQSEDERSGGKRKKIIKRSEVVASRREDVYPLFRIIMI